MAGVWADQGISDALQAIVTNVLNGTARIHLFQNNVTPTNATVVGDFTEATFSGYSAATVVSYAAPVVSAHIATSTPPGFTFTITSGTQNIYGWYVTNNAGTRLLFSQRDPAAPVPMDPAAINAYTIFPTVTQKDQAT